MYLCIVLYCLWGLIRCIWNCADEKCDVFEGKTRGTLTTLYNMYHGQENTTYNIYIQCWLCGSYLVITTCVTSVLVPIILFKQRCNFVFLLPHIEKRAKVMFSQASVCPSPGGSGVRVTPNATSDRVRTSNPPPYSQWAGGTHHTGMHSCFLLRMNFIGMYCVHGKRWQAMQ